MKDTEAARAYLAVALERGGIPPKVASEALGLNHAYLQQYIKYGKPRWLSEGVRRGLAQLLPLDEEKLKPPPKTLVSRPKKTVRNGHHQGQINAPSHGKGVDDPGTFELLRIWATLPPDRRQLALRVLRIMAEDAGAIVA